MKYFATLIPIKLNRAMPVIICELMYESSSLNYLLRDVYREKFLSLTYKQDNNRIDLYFNGFKEYQFFTKSSFTNCLKDAKILLVEFHVWIIDDILDKVIDKFFINAFIKPDKLPEQVSVEEVPFFNIKDHSGKKLTLWEKNNGIPS